ncbi:hypothetical protein RI578_12200 [Streptomyces sp. BB1-1-1]|uniref:tetratricopeptide repeat protein n=1 Tax=Streptomyces sp. BB1-1-1 TaxID=3074430 RepID=UPI002877CA30|nr:hypothetical protein [Streptomyces sp. BB1-1-1]WND34996.1 hypothetical protein RI578_12200 [Streptomyces sp. BB1-1-1]
MHQPESGRRRLLRRRKPVQATRRLSVTPSTLEHGHLDLVIQAAKEREEWFCAERAAQELCRSGEFVQAMGVMKPFAAIGWRPALWAKANVLLRAGRTDEALDLVRPDEERLTSQYVCRDFAELLVRAGRVDEAIELLVPHLGGGGSSRCWWKSPKGKAATSGC